MKITIIGAAIIDILARPVDRDMFEKGSMPVQDMRMNIGGDAANEALVLAGLEKRFSFGQYWERIWQEG